VVKVPSVVDAPVSSAPLAHDRRMAALEIAAPRATVPLTAMPAPAPLPPLLPTLSLPPPPPQAVNANAAREGTTTLVIADFERIEINLMLQ
jgi:hypothetical protein